VTGCLLSDKESQRGINSGRCNSPNHNTIQIHIYEQYMNYLERGTESIEMNNDTGYYPSREECTIPVVNPGPGNETRTGVTGEDDV
jgi:hypothetical protein